MAYKQLKLWFDQALAITLSAKINQIDPSINLKHFIREVKNGVDHLELKDRVELISDLLYKYIPGSYADKLKILVQILGPENDKETGMFKEFYWIMPIAKFVEKYGLEDFKISMRALKEITKRNTSEYAIRPFLRKHTDKTLRQLVTWSTDKNAHVRRLSSEGGRPRLPWAKKMDMFIADPSPLIPILNNLQNDPSKYVQKSVANCINDILKDNHSIGMDLLNSWSDQPTKNTQWIIKHALRNQA